MAKPTIAPMAPKEVIYGYDELSLRETEAELARVSKIIRDLEEEKKEVVKSYKEATDVMKQRLSALMVRHESLESAKKNAQPVAVSLAGDLP